MVFLYQYKIMNSLVYATDPNYMLYSLEKEQGTVDMKINKQNTNMEFLYSNYHIYLTIGKSTKL
jgi:hypothetical protein